MKIVLTINVPGGDAEGILEELELDIIDAIQGGETSGEAGFRCHPAKKGTWKIEGLPKDGEDEEENEMNESRKKVIRLTESDLMRIVKRVINEQG